MERAEKKAKLGIQFLTPDETTEEQYRRLVAELKEIQDEVPRPIVEKVLDEHGFMLKTTAEEAKRAMAAADALAREQLEKEAQAAPVEEAPVPVPQVPIPAPQAPVQASQAPVGAPVHTPSPADLMRARQPMNTAPMEVNRNLQPQVQNVVPATRQPVAMPPQDAVPAHMLQGAPTVGTVPTRSAQMAALEADADSAGLITNGTQELPVRPSQVPVIQKRQPALDPKAILGNIDQPPRVGLNPHFRKPQRP